jgi:hypothetical protein
MALFSEYVQGRALSTPHTRMNGHSYIANANYKGARAWQKGEAEGGLGAAELRPIYFIFSGPAVTP